ncbi:MAG: TRAP transporter small permease [Pseudomonadota bacterium]|nr:TRAP transporter small permease [Pseudomonadota bacterium]
MSRTPTHRYRDVRRALVGAFDTAALFVCCALVAALLGCVAVGAITRTLGDPLIWTDELSRFLMVWLAVFGWVVASRKRIHVRIRFFQDRLPARGHRATEVAIQSAMTLFGGLSAAYSVGLIGKNHDLQATTLPISMAWMYMPMVLGGAITALQGASEIVGTLRRRTQSRPPGDEEATVE